MLVEKDGENPRAPRDLAISLDKGGDAKVKLDDIKGALVYFEEGLTLRKQLADANKSNYQYRRDVSLTLDRIGAAKLELNDIPGSLAAAEESLAIARDLAELRKNDTEAQTDLVVGLYKLAKVAAGERKDAAINEGLQLLARLDADGKLPTIRRAGPSRSTPCATALRRPAPPAARKGRIPPECFGHCAPSHHLYIPAIGHAGRFGPRSALRPP